MSHVTLHLASSTNSSTWSQVTPLAEQFKMVQYTIQLASSGPAGLGLVTTLYVSATLCYTLQCDLPTWPPTPCWWQEHDNDDGGLETQMHLKSQVSFLFLFRYHDTCELSQQQTTYTMTAPSLARNVRWRGIFLQCFPTVRGRTLAGIPYLLYIFYFHFALLTYLFVTVWLLPYCYEYKACIKYNDLES